MSYRIVLTILIILAMIALIYFNVTMPDDIVYIDETTILTRGT